MPVCGERVEMLNLLELGAPVPVRGPVEMTIMFSGSSGFSLPVKLSYMIFEAIALPPRYSCLSLSVHGYSETLRLPRSRRMTLPM